MLYISASHSYCETSVVVVPYRCLVSFFEVVRLWLDESLWCTGTLSQADQLLLRALVLVFPFCFFKMTVMKPSSSASVLSAWSLGGAVGLGTSGAWQLGASSFWLFFFLFCFFLKLCLGVTNVPASVFLLVGGLLKDCWSVLVLGKAGESARAHTCSLTVHGERREIGRRGREQGGSLVTCTTGRESVEGDSWGEVKGILIRGGDANGKDW